MRLPVVPVAEPGLRLRSWEVVRSIPPPATVLFEPGFRFDGYELLVKIGQGGMASVWLARTKNSDDEDVLVAIKTILPELAAIEELRSMMLDESRIATALVSPYVAIMLKVGEVWQIPYIVLEYVPGESIDQLCDSSFAKKKTVPAPITSRILIDTCMGLAAAHNLRADSGEELGLVHRDMSPQNVLVDENGHVKLIDFGIAMAKERITPETADGVMKGKIPFMAPEHAMGGDVDRRSDLWSLGAVGYLMLTGKEPYEGPNDAARLIRKLSREPLPPLPDSVPKPLVDVIVKVLSHSPDDRYPTAEAFAEALEAAGKPASSAEVASYFRETLGETMRTRELLVERAIAAATARSRAREMLSNPDFSTYTAEGSTASKPPRSPEPSPSPDTTLSLPPPAEPPQRTWVVYLIAAAIALAVVVAYTLGASTNRTASSTAPASTGSSLSASPSTSSNVPVAVSLVPLDGSTPPRALTSSATATPVLSARGLASPLAPTTAPKPSAVPSASVPSASVPTPPPSTKTPEETIF